MTPKVFTRLIATPRRVTVAPVIFAAAIVAGVSIKPAPGEQATVEVSRNSLIDSLRQSFANETNFIRIHAAEALVEHGMGDEVAAVLTREAATAPSITRVGVWRVLARTSSDSARAGHVAKLRHVMLSEGEPDRIHAAEALAKLNQALPDDREAITRLADEASPPQSCHPLWLLTLTGDAKAEGRLAGLLDSPDEVARLVAAYVIGRLPTISDEARRKLVTVADNEPTWSPALGYLLAAATLRGKELFIDQRLRFRRRLIDRLKDGSVNERYEAALAIGSTGDLTDLEHLQSLLSQPGDPRIGAAQGALRILKRHESRGR